MFNFLKLKKYNVLFLTILSTVILGIFIFYSRVQKSSSDNNVLVIGTASGYAPYVSLNEKGEYEGFDIDFAKALAARMKRKLIIKDLGSMTSLLLGLSAGKIDAIIWAMSITKERLKKLSMVYYQGEETKSLPLVFWKEIPAGIKTINDLAGYKNNVVCVEPGSSQDSVLSKFNFIQPRPVEKIAVDGVLEIKYGKAIAALFDPSVFSNLKSNCQELVSLEVVLDDNDQVFGNGVAIKKENSILASEIKKAVDDLIKDGTIAEFEKKWNLKE